MLTSKEVIADLTKRVGWGYKVPKGDYSYTMLFTEWLKDQPFILHLDQAYFERVKQYLEAYQKECMTSNDGSEIEIFERTEEAWSSDPVNLSFTLISPTDRSTRVFEDTAALIAQTCIFQVSQPNAYPSLDSIRAISRGIAELISTLTPVYIDPTKIRWAGLNMGQFLVGKVVIEFYVMTEQKYIQKYTLTQLPGFKEKSALTRVK